MGPLRALIGWAARLPLAAAPALAPLRAWIAVEARLDGEWLWLRGPSTDSGPAERLRMVPGALRFDRLAGDRLAPAGRRLPDRLLPAGGWRPLAELLALAPQTAALAGRVERRMPLVLVADAVEREPGALLLPFDRLAAWAVAAPAVRLKPLRLAADHAGRALVVGRPLPPLRGDRLTSIDGILLPAGQVWSPPIEAETLRRLLGLAPGELALFEEDGWERIPVEGLVRLSRSAVRATR